MTINFWRVTYPDGHSLMCNSDTRPDEDDEYFEGRVKAVAIANVTAAEFAQMMDEDAADSHYSALEGYHGYIQKLILKASNESVARRVLRQMYEDTGGLHNVY